jgi:UDP-2-acetamido-3-amino-2,3-dideoxy-glucuronate N-acetyltransferase
VSQKKQAKGGKPAQVAKPDYFVHESAYVDDGTEIGAGTKVWHFCHVMPGARIGKGCVLGQNVNVGSRAILGDNVKVQNNVSIYDDVILEDDVFCGPSMVFTNVLTPRAHVNRKNEYARTLIGRGASLGANCTVVCGHNVGRYAFVGAGAVVTRNVPDYALVVGNPARQIGWMCNCGARLAAVSPEATCARCGKRYRQAGAGIEEVS